MRRENGIVEIEATDVVIGTFIFEEEIDTLICNNQFLIRLKAPNVKNIVANDNNILHFIEAPNAITIDCNNCSGLMKINAPNCINLKCENTPLLFLDRVSVAKNCEIQTGGELKFKNEKYAYIETNDGAKYDRTNNITKEKGLLDWEFSEYAVLRNYIEHKGKLFTTAEIVLCDRNDITSIEAPNARYISCENCKNLTEVNAPYCTHIYCKGTDRLDLANLKVFSTCKVREVEEVMIGELETIIKKEEEYIRIYKVVDRGKNKKIDEIETRYFFTKEEAEYYADIKDVNIGSSNVIETFEAKKSSFTNDMFQEKFKSLEDLFDKHYKLFDFEQEEVIKYNEGKDINGGIVVAWNWERYVDYARNLEGVGVAGADGTFGYYNLKTEADLITGNENNTYGTNYSLLLSPDEIKRELGNNYTEEELEELIDERLIESIWLWNDLKNNPYSKNIIRDIEEVVKNRLGNYAFIEQENGEKIDESSFIIRDEVIGTLFKKEFLSAGKLVTNTDAIICKNSDITNIEAPKAKNISCDNCENLEEVNAPNCTLIYCENCPELKEENMELSYDCQIKGLEKKNQLRR